MWCTQSLLTTSVMLSPPRTVDEYANRAVRRAGARRGAVTGLVRTQRQLVSEEPEEERARERPAVA